MDGNGGVIPDPSLKSVIIAGLGLSGNPYLYQHNSQGGTKQTLYGIRETAAGVVINGVEEQTGNEVLIYWEEAGEKGILWPKYYSGYILKWPTDQDRYSTYARSDQSLGDAAATGIQLSSANNPTLVYQDDPTNQHAVLGPGNVFYTNVSASNPDGRALIRYTNGDTIWFERVFSQLDTTFLNFNSPASVDIGTRILPPDGAETAVGYIRQAAGTAFDVGSYLDPFVNGFEQAKRGAIIGVNNLVNNDQLEVWWYKKSTPPGGLITGTYWPQFVRKYKLQWPASPTEIVLASNEGSGDLPSLQAQGRIYYQNVPTNPGYNPNEEHALMINGRAWALRDDLNVAASSKPYVLVSYLDAEQRPAMSVFKVLRENAIYKFNYSATAGTVLQSPLPLPLLPAPLDAKLHTANYEFQTAPVDPVPNFDATRDVNFTRYQRFTFIDRKGTVWVYRGPHSGNSAPGKNFAMRYFYKTQPGFDYPGLVAQPAVGTITPYLRPAVSTFFGLPPTYIGDPVTGIVAGEKLPRPLDIVFTPQWPTSAPELRISETLTAAKLGLPAVRGQTSAELIYQQSVATDPNSNRAMVDRLKSARLFDPTRAKTYPLSAATLSALPNSVKTDTYLGKQYFPNLPPHLSQRLFFDPSVGAKGSLIFQGEFRDEPVGEKYLLLDIMSSTDLAAVKGLCLASDDRKVSWDKAIDGLTTKLETFVEDPKKAGTYIVNPGDIPVIEQDYAGNPISISPASLPLRSPRDVGVADSAEIFHSDTAVDSYAVAGSGGGEGFVVLAVGNGKAFTPQGEPVSLHVFKVTDPLYRGELKVVNSSNPLDEKLTMQHSGDFAGHPEEYEFEWRYGLPVDGVPPQLYTYQRTLIVGDSNGTPATEWRLFPDPAADYAKYRGVDVTLTGSTVVNLPNQTVVINDGAGTAANGTTLPNAVLRRQFAAAQIPLHLFLSADFGAHSGAILYVNGAETAIWNVPGRADSFETGSPGGSYNPLTHLFEISPNVLHVGQNTITLELYSDADPNVAIAVNARLEGAQESEDLTQWLPLGVSPGEAAGTFAGSAIGKVRHVIGGTSILTLSDNYFIVRYRARNTDNAAYDATGGWSKWVNPQLAEGWIKRVLAGINPFQQRITDLFNNSVDLDVSLLTQAGKRWEGDIALNLQNINSFGLIEIYETVLRRGRMLSIDGTPALNFGGANDALLLASGYLNDLYMVLGNEAFADAANPTIAFSSVTGDGTAGNVATSLFAFKGQLATVLDEELAMLRGRDDSLQPGTRTAPVYNRLFWNYTRGIDSGEAIYALNYNIRDVNLDGVIDAKDAAVLYPQAHGDAYGHYLTALTNYYGLLRNDHFSWTPRTEAVLVLGQAVQVDYTDERKFAGAAAALARTANQIVDLTYRQQYSAAENAGWTQLRDGKANATTGRTRYWGADEWASRGGQGALFHWVTGNSLLPAVDPNPGHEGIQKIDRTTVPELGEIVAQASALQQTLDNADARLNPLGLSRGALQFDLDPTFLDVGSTAQTGLAAIQGLTHYDQIYQRAFAALKNAVTAFNNAQSSTQFLRDQEDSLAAQRIAITEQERVFTNQLIELYGTPYTDDIGPGRTYQQGYTGPDLLHSMYVEITENLASGNFTPIEDYQFNIYTVLDPQALHDMNFAGFDPNDSHSTFMGISENQKIIYTLSGIRGEFRRPTEWTGKRTSPGRMQTAISDLLLARQEVYGAVYDFDRLKTVINQQIALYQSAVQANGVIHDSMVGNQIAQSVLESLETALFSGSLIIDNSLGLIEHVTVAGSEALPIVVGLAVDPSFAARAALRATAAVSYGSLVAIKTALDISQKAAEQAQASLNRALDLKIFDAQWERENAQLLNDLRSSLQGYYTLEGTIDAAMRRMDQAERDLSAVRAEGDRIQQQRLVFRQQAAALVQGYRTRDFAFRAFRNEALEKYKSLFDLASKYTYMAARAYDYETGLLDPDGSSIARGFYEKIVRARSPGVITDSVPQLGGSTTGDPGLAGVLAQMNGDWAVVKTRFGLNNPQPAHTLFSLRGEKFRIVPGADGAQSWKDVLVASRMKNIVDDPDVKRYCMQVADQHGADVPGFVIPFSSTIANGVNFFGQPLAGGDHTFTPTEFTTKIRSSGIAFPGYVGMDSPSVTADAVVAAGGTSPGDPNTGFTDPTALSATPYIYFIPAGSDSMRAPPLGDTSVIRTWNVDDQAIPLPFNIGASDFATNSSFIGATSLSELPFVIRKHPAFRAVPDGTAFPESRTFTSSRLIGRSAWNSRWKIVIPGRTLLANPEQGLDIFTKTVSDIKLHLETYSYSGN